MAIRRPQVERIKAARREVISANDGKDSTREDRRRAAARLEAVRRNSTPEEWEQGFGEHVLS